MNAPPVVATQNFLQKTWVKIVAVVVIVALASIYPISRLFYNYSTLATPKNIQNARNVQRAVLEGRYLGTMMSRGGLSQTAGLPEDQKLLINYNVLSVRNLGFSGPIKDGVFDEELATRLALSSGARLVILEIDRTESGEPTLMYRDPQNYVQSMNTGSIQKIAQTLADRAWTATNDAVPSRLADDPLFLVLYFKTVPNNFSATAEYLRFLAKVAKQLQPLRGRIIGQTPQGDFRRQGGESQLFFMSLSIFMRKCVVICNVDTSQFRNKEQYGMPELRPEEDLDLLVNVRAYSRESPSGLGATVGPSQSVTPAVVITTPDYWLNTPPDRQRDAIDLTKKAFTIAMYNASEKELTRENIDKLYDSYGVQSVPFSIFDDTKKTDIWIGKDARFAPSGWQAKKEMLRFIPPKPIEVLKQNPKANSGKGFVVAPTL